VRTFRYKPYDFWVIQLAQTVDAGIYKLSYDFNGNLLLGGLSGLYRSNYFKGNETIGLASTQFEFIDARKAFPCFDEPSFKSTFELTLIHDKHMNTTLSNMPIVSEDIDESLNWVTTKYSETVPMVTYLVAIAVSDFVCKGSNIDNIDVGVCASPVQSYKLDYALEKTQTCIHHFAKDYLQVDYPLPKVDMIAIPDFSYGAMENWGLVTFRETALLWHEDEGTSANKMSVTAIIAHELAHFVSNFFYMHTIFTKFNASKFLIIVTSGSETWSPVSGGHTYGLMRVLLLLWSIRLLIIVNQIGIMYVFTINMFEFWEFIYH